MPAATAVLTEAHRIAQLRLASATTVQMRNLWHLLDVEDLNGTFDRWLTAAVPLVSNSRAASARLAGNYYTAHRTLALGVEAPPFTPLLADTLADDRLTAALLVTGPGSIKKALDRGVSVDQAASVAEVNSARTAVYYAQSGGWETTTDTIAADPEAVGYARVLSGSEDACAFCLMLASRGHVYNTEDTASFEAHPGCGCTPEPAYDHNAPLPPRSQEAQQLWRDATTGLRPGEDRLNAFRRHLSAKR